MRSEGGRLIHGLRGEFSKGRLVRLEADSDDDRDFVADFIDTDRMGRRLGEIALVDASSRIGETGRIYYNTLLDENAAAHIAFGSGFGGTRSETPARGVNHSTIHLDVMIGGPELEATGFDARGRTAGSGCCVCTRSAVARGSPERSCSATWRMTTGSSRSP